MNKSVVRSLILVTLLLIPESYVLISCKQSQELKTLQLSGLPVYYSTDDSTRAAFIGQRTQQAMALYDTLFGFSPEVELLVLNPEDWKNHTQMPVYGMPHYSNGRLIVASRENKFWSDFLPPLDNLPDKMAELIRKTYTDKDGNLSMKKFFDLIVIHELGHGYHMQAHVDMQRKWLQEMFANLLMYTYTAEIEPDMLPVIDVFSSMVVERGTGGYKFTSLQEFEDHYSEIASQSPQNYGWYQSKLNLVAKKIYENGGAEQIDDLWRKLKNTKSQLSDEQLSKLLINTLGNNTANDLIEWQQD